MPPDCCCLSFVLVVWPTHGTRALLWFKHAQVEETTLLISRAQVPDSQKTSSSYVPQPAQARLRYQTVSTCYWTKLYTVAMRQPSPLLTDWLTDCWSEVELAAQVQQGGSVSGAHNLHIHERSAESPPLPHYEDNHILRTASEDALAVMWWKIKVVINCDL